jgi:hypothetical protein
MHLWRLELITTFRPRKVTFAMDKLSVQRLHDEAAMSELFSEEYWNDLHDLIGATPIPTIRETLNADCKLHLYTRLYVHAMAPGILTPEVFLDGHIDALPTPDQVDAIFVSLPLSPETGNQDLIADLN